MKQMIDCQGGKAADVLVVLAAPEGLYSVDECLGHFKELRQSIEGSGGPLESL